LNLIFILISYPQLYPQQNLILKIPILTGVTTPFS